MLGWGCVGVLAKEFENWEAEAALPDCQTGAKVMNDLLLSLLVRAARAEH